MKAIVYHEYGPPDVLRMEEVAKPTPKDNELLIRVRATSVGYGDVMARKFGNTSPRRDFNMPLLFWVLARMAFGVRRPKKPVLGAQFAGEVEAIGRQVTRLNEGDQVFGYRGSSFGANAEYLCMSEDGVVAPKPASMTYEEAAAVPYGALTALNLLRKAGVQRGQRVLVIGASGSIGSAAVQLAKHFGAEVAGVCGTPGVDLVKALGADRVIDYTREDFIERDETYDLIVDVLGKGSFSRSKPVLRPKGRYLFASFKTGQLVQMLWTSMTGGKRVLCALSMEKREDLLLVKELAEAGVIKSYIDRCYPLEQTAEAHRYVEGGHKKGHVVIAVE